MSLYRPIRLTELNPRTNAGRATCALIALLALQSIASRADAGDYYVDPSRPGASDSGPGSSDVPCRTIQGAVTAFGSAGNTINVRPGIYRETVTLSASGAPDQPIVLRASGPGVIITGSESFSVPAHWTPTSGGEHLAAAVTWRPSQVFIDGARLSPGPALPAPLPLQTFRWITGEGLYVNIGSNPGSHVCEVGRRPTGVSISGAHVIIEGLEINRTEDRAVLVAGPESVVRDCTIRFAYKYGIDVVSAPDLELLRNKVSDNGDHGIYVKASARCRIAYNESFRNARPSVRAANGLNIDGSSGCVVENNRFHHNQDSGLQFVNGATNGLSRNNVSWANGDHGFDHVRATGIRHYHDVAQGNMRDGFSFEGVSKGGAMFNCIAINNGLTTNEFNLWVEDASAEGFESDYNLIWNSTSQKPIKFRGFQFASLAEYSSSSGHDRHSRSQSPRFFNPSNGDFRLRAGSPAIDAATAAFAACPSSDAEDQWRFDDPTTANAGAGAPAYADLGANEYRNACPVAVLRSNPAQGVAHQPIELSAAASTDADGSILSYAFDFGDGSPAPVAQASPVITHVYGPGVHSAAVIVTDGYGAKDTARVTISIAADRAPILTTPVEADATAGERVTVYVTAADPDGDALTALTADLSQLPAGSNATFVPNSTRTEGTFTWTPAASNVRGSGYRVMFTASNTMSDTSGTTIFVKANATNLCGNAGFESALTGWGAYGSATLTRVAGGHSGGFCAEVRATGSTTMGLGDNPNWVTVPAAGVVYRYSAWVRSAASTGNAKLVIREFLNGAQQGTTISSAMVRLSPVWQQISAEIRTITAGSTLEFEVKDYQVASPEVFQIDDVSIVRVTGGSVSVSQADSASVAGRFFAAITPNPLRSKGTLDLVLTRRGTVDVQIYDLEGRSVASPCASRIMDAGRHRVALSLAETKTKMTPGAYFYRVVADEGVLTGKVLVIR